jgi:hypothetical protein
LYVGGVWNLNTPFIQCIRDQKINNGKCGLNYYHEKLLSDVVARELDFWMEEKIKASLFK